MKSIIFSLFCAFVQVTLAATCTFNGSWDATPSSGDDIVITSGTLTWDTTLPASVKSWTQSGGTVTIGTTFDDTFPYLEVTGDISLTGGTWTHKANAKATIDSTANKYRLYVKCGGNMTIGSGAAITALGLGYQTIQAVDGKKDTSTQGGTYGGHGAVANAMGNWTYGSYSAPEDLGNAGKWSGAYGGGAIRLDVTGKMTLNGSIAADSPVPPYASGGYFYAGSGGSVYLNVGSIAGTGTLSADAANCRITGGGGRIAVILHDEGADFSNFDLKTQASAKSLKTGDANVGGCGTIYGETRTDKKGEGWLVLRGTGTAPTGVKYNLGWADPFTYECTSLHFAKISILGATKLAIREGYTLDITDTVIDVSETDKSSGSIFYLLGGTLASEKALSIDYSIDCRAASTLDMVDLTIGSGSVLRGVDKITVSGNLTVASGGKMTTDAATTSPTHRLDVNVGGDMTIDAGGAVDVTGCGYARNNGPDGAISDSSGGSHGGWGITSTGVENKVSPYGSIVNPLTPGAGGGQDSAPNSSVGGGVAQFQIDGLLTVNGSILANGAAGTHYTGAGGSVNLTAGGIAGSADAIIEASSGKASQTTAAAAGGRIAIRLTGDNADFTAYLGATCAYSYGNSNGSKYGGAGTVYLQTAAQGEGGGTLIVDNGTAKKMQGATLVGGTTEGTSFGSIIIRNKAKLVLADNASLTVKGNFQNESVFTAGAGSTIIFAGMGDSVISGNNTFVNVNCTTGGKTIKFTAGSKQTLTGALTVAGDETPVTLCSTEKGSAWELDTSAGVATLSGVEIGDCHSTAAITVTDGKDLTGNVNVTVIASITPETITWSGAADGSWANADNWDIRVPTKVDTVIIPAGTRTATLAANTKVAALTVAGALDVADKGISVTGNMTVSGSLVASGTAPIEVGGAFTGSGTFTAGSSVVTLNGEAAQAVTCGDSFAFNSLVISSPGATFSGRLTCASLTLGAGTFTFADGMTVAATSFNVVGSALAPNAVLRAASETGIWHLKVSLSDVTGACVSGSDASGGVMIVPASSLDNGRNTNWLFNDTRIHWSGAVDSDFANPANWEGGVLPKATDAVVIEGDVGAVITGETTVAGLTIEQGGTLTVNTNLTCNGSLVINPNGTLVANKPIVLADNLTALDGATITHALNNGKVEAYKVDITVGGSGYFASSASVDVKGKGFAHGGVYRGPGSVNATADSFAGASHGGRGYHGATLAAACYGSALNPVTLGSAGGWTGDGGGAVILRFGGALTLDGTINADASDGRDPEGQGGSYYSGSGGSINVRAASLTGTGTLRAFGGKLLSSGGSSAGAGGRIAVELTDPSAAVSAFAGSIVAYGGLKGEDSNGSAGTIYTKDGVDGSILMIKQNERFVPKTSDVYIEMGGGQIVTNRVYNEMTDFPMADDATREKTLPLTVDVKKYGVLNVIADAEIAALKIAADAKVKLNGHTLRVHMRRPKRDKTIYDDSRVDTTDGGKIVWDTLGLMLILK